MPQNLPDRDQKWEESPTGTAANGSRKINGTDVVVWDEMVVVEFGAGYWYMNERLSTTKIHSVSIACVPANIWTRGPSEHEPKPLSWVSIAPRVLDKDCVNVVKCIQQFQGKAYVLRVKLNLGFHNIRTFRV